MDPDALDRNVDQEKALRNTLIKLHVENGKLSVFPTLAEENPERPGRPKLGPAEASEVVHDSWPAMVSYVVENDTEVLSTAADITASDLNPPPTLVKGDALKPFMARPDAYILPQDGKPFLSYKPIEINRHFNSSQHGIALKEYTDRERLLMHFKAAEMGIPVWEHILDEVKLRSKDNTAGTAPHRRSKSVNAYRPSNMRDTSRSRPDQSLYELANKHVAEAQPRFHADARVQEVTGEEIMIELHKFLLQRPYYRTKNRNISKNKIKIFRLWLRYHCHWLVSANAIEKVVLLKYKVISTGLIPVKSSDIVLATEEDAAVDELRKLPTLKSTNTYGDLELELEPEQAPNRKAPRRTIPRARNAHSQPAIAPRLLQNEEDSVRLTIWEDPNVKSYIRIRHTVNYLDASLPDMQPRHLAYVELTHRNTTGKGKDYTPTHRIHDVSDKAWKPALRKLFPQTVKAQGYYEDLYQGLRQSNHKLFLITIKHNDKPFTSNLLTRKQDVPNLVRDLQTVIRQSPKMFMLVRGTGLEAKIHHLVEQWKDLYAYDPLNVFFMEPNNPSLTHKGIKPTEHLPKFQSIGRSTFEDWHELVRAAGIGALMEQRATTGEYHYNGQAAVVPVPGTFHRDGKVYLSYHLQVLLEHQADKPKLVAGDYLAVIFDPDPKANANSEGAWHGRVTEPVPATSMGMLNITIDRPWRDHSIADTEEHTPLNEQHLKEMTVHELRMWVQRNCLTPIKVFCKKDGKECKRMMGNHMRMTVPAARRIDYEEKSKRLDAYRELLLCKDHTQFEPIPLYDSVDRDQLQRALSFMKPFLRPHQHAEFEKWENLGVYARTTWITGPSGSGKTFLGLITVLPFLLDIRVEDTITAISNHEVLVELQRKAAVEASEQSPPNTDAPATEALASEATSSNNTVDDPLFCVPDSGSYTVQKGRITTVAMQNDAVDEQYRLMSRSACQFATAMKMKRPLVLRLHSKSAEIDAIKALTRPGYRPYEKAVPFNINPATKVTDELSLSLLNAYLAYYHGTEGSVIRDSRFKQLEGSAAKYILQLAGFPKFSLSEELRDTFTVQELKDLKERLEPIVLAHKDLSVDDEMTKELEKKIEKAAKIGMEALIEKAAVICTTISIATQQSFNLLRKSHAVLLEEAGRANDIETMGLFAHYWNAEARIIIGAVNQLSPAAFGDPKQNPFQKQITMSTIARFQATGGEVSQLQESSRFRGPELLDLCRLVNDMPLLQATTGAFDSTLTKEYSDINAKIWGIDSPLIFINTQDVHTQSDANRSKFSLETAAVVMKDTIERLQFIEGRYHTIITPYNAQRMVLKRELEDAVKMAKAQGKDTMARRLTDVEIVTIDSFMGRDQSSVTVDTAGTAGHLLDMSRTVVACTRARVSCQLVGPTLHYTDPLGRVKASHPIAKLIRKLDKAGHIRQVLSKELRTYEQYHPTLESIGLSSFRTGDVKGKEYNDASMVTALVRDENTYDDEERDIISMMGKAAKNIPELAKKEDEGGWCTAGDSSNGGQNATNASSGNTDWDAGNEQAVNTDWGAGNEQAVNMDWGAGNEQADNGPEDTEEEEHTEKEEHAEEEDDEEDDEESADDQSEFYGDD